MSERCEPPPEWRERDGWHWVAKSQREISAYWTAHDQWWDTVHSSGSGPAFAGSGYRYLAPVTPPATVAALVEAIERFIPALWLLATSGNADAVAMHDEARAILALYRGEAGR